jgi:hypothetical protein
MRFRHQDRARRQDRHEPETRERRIDEAVAVLREGRKG